MLWSVCVLWPISNLTFMSKIVERLVCRQLVTFLQKHNLLPTHQSAYRRQHSTETAVLKIVSDLLLACDRGQVSLLALLDLSAAFDTVDHSILIDRLQSAFVIRGPVIEWICDSGSSYNLPIPGGGGNSGKAR